jgi:hypothetical protein|nr:MAG TPA: hypothetical protein [Caudoviricetes sp.]
MKNKILKVIVLGFIGLTIYQMFTIRTETKDTVCNGGIVKICSGINYE